VNQKGSELPLEQAFAKMINSMENGLIKYINIFFTCLAIKAITIAHTWIWVFDKPLKLSITLSNHMPQIIHHHDEKCAL